jgi:Ca-activated chloride channel homolog
LLLEVLILPFFAAALVYGQFTSGVDLVEVYATVTDASGRVVEGLAPDDFRVAEDGVPQSVSAFAAGDVPLALAIAVDRSFSMKARGVDRLALAKSAAGVLVGSLRPTDLLTVVAIGSEVEVVCPLTADRGAAVRAIEGLDLWGSTRLYDGTIQALDVIQAARGRRALVLLSDGADRGSDNSAAALIDAARRRDVITYPIAIGSARPPIFAELATATGGRSFAVSRARPLEDAAREIAHELRSQYLIGYAPAHAGERVSPSARWHAIDVSVNRPGMRVRARDGYFSP